MNINGRLTVVVWVIDFAHSVIREGGVAMAIVLLLLRAEGLAWWQWLLMVWFGFSALYLLVKVLMPSKPSQADELEARLQSEDRPTKPV